MIKIDSNEARIELSQNPGFGVTRFPDRLGFTDTQNWNEAMALGG